MTHTESRAVIGIGSSHGQDAIGWRVVERLIASPIADTRWMIARSPSEILDRCEGIRELHLVDACVGSQAGRLHRLTWPDPRIESMRWTSSHGLDVPGALFLAKELKMLPESVTIWAIECDGNPTDGSWPNALQQGIESAVERIASALRFS